MNLIQNILIANTNYILSKNNQIRAPSKSPPAGETLASPTDSSKIQIRRLF